MKKVALLRKKYPRFIYERYFWEILNGNLNISFCFRIEKNSSAIRHRVISFQPKVIIENINKSRIKKIGESALNNFIFNLGLIELVSYWKATCSPEIEIRAGSLNKEQVLWWKELISNGMGQFFYENKIDFQKPNFLKIVSIVSSKINITRNVLVMLKNRVLVPMGGGKDSIVTLEILSSFAPPSLKFRRASKDSEGKEKIDCFSLNPTDAAKKIMEIAGCLYPIIVKREIDSKLLELNRKGFLNGHTPFSAYLAFLSALLASIFDFKYIAFSQEQSSNEGNINYLGLMVNHQYSKSFDFEKKFRDYSQKYLARNIEYFSFLRPLYEIQIAKLFSKFPKYFNAFLSCNEAYKTNSGIKKPTRKWCGKCPKCLFIFTILYPFIEEKNLLKIFGKNLFANEKLLPIMLQLLGEKELKPFECVGTKKESLIAFYLSWKKSMSFEKLPFLLEYFEEKILPRTEPKALVRGLPKHKNLEKESKKILKSWSNQNYLPKHFEKILKSYVGRVEK